MRIKAISCPQCSSTDVEMISDIRGKCHMCGSMFQIEAEPPVQAASVDACDKFKILPEHSESDFLRKVWISLAKENAPSELFSEDFGEVQKTEHEVFFESVSVEVDYQASIGYDREEPYIAYETYYEDEPYLTTESYYDSNTKSQSTRMCEKRPYSSDRPLCGALFAR